MIYTSKKLRNKERNKTMKKFVAILLTLMLVLGMTAAVAESTLVIPKEYPADTSLNAEVEDLTFTVVEGTHTDLGVNAGTPALPTVSYDKGTRQIKVTAPTYNDIGKYNYTIKEDAGNVAGVTYDTNVYYFQVLVTVGANGNLVTEIGSIKNADKEKIEKITNNYQSASLAVKKEVTGNLGDKDKAFDVDVTFTANGKVIAGTISYTDDGEAKTIPSTAWNNGTAKVTITLKHDETVTFTGIPYDVGYSVAEHDYSADEYTTTYDGNESQEKVAAATYNTTITNKKDGQIDTGVTTESLPYVVLMGFVVLAGAALLLKRKAHNN